MLNLPRIGFQPAMMGLIFVVSSCANQPTEPPSQDRIIINNNYTALKGIFQNTINAPLNVILTIVCHNNYKN